MKLLEMCNYMFDKTPDGSSVKRFFQEMREEENAKTDKGEDNTDRGFFMLCVSYLGGRGYNEFLDYSLFAIKLNAIFNKHTELSEDNRWSRMEEAINNLLADDRHDMYQNIPYELDDVAKSYKEEERRARFWSDVVDAMIECINIKGTGDVSVNFVVEED